MVSFRQPLPAHRRPVDSHMPVRVSLHDDRLATCRPSINRHTDRLMGMISLDHNERWQDSMRVYGLVVRSKEGGSVGTEA
jgi:hypothetical protein